MSLPDGVTTCTVTYGPITNSLGTNAESITVELVASRTLIHVTSGRTLFKSSQTFTADAGAQVEIPVPHTDQAGFRDLQGNDFTGWYYDLYLTAKFASGTETDRKRFQPLVGQTSVDADLLESDGLVTSGVTTTSAVVTSVAGLTGAVTAEDLGFVPSSPAVVTTDLDDVVTNGFYTVAPNLNGDPVLNAPEATSGGAYSLTVSGGSVREGGAPAPVTQTAIYVGDSEPPRMFIRGYDTANFQWSEWVEVAPFS